MKPDTPHALSLQPGGVCSLRNIRDTVVVVLAGRIWLTQTGVSDDYFLAPGQQHHVPHSDHVVLQCLGGSPARVELQQALAWSAALGEMT